MGEAKRRRAIALSNLKVPTSRTDELPVPGIFGRDDFFRARYFSEVIAVYANEAEQEAIVTFARDKRMPFMSFADQLEAMARFLHAGGEVDKLIESSRKPQAQLEAEFKFVEIVRTGIKRYRGGGKQFSLFLREGLHQLFPKATVAQIDSALSAGNREHGFNAYAVIEAMMTVNVQREANT